MALIVGLGAVLTVDWFGVPVDARTAPTERRATDSPHAPGPHLARAGRAGHHRPVPPPNVAAPLTLFKLGPVLVITLNGLYAHWIGQRLGRHKAIQAPRRLRVQAGAATAVSQIGWWGASVIGNLNSHS
ncbi:hypothetical protein [Streptomyces nigrescens]|uniref:hypothetical protein n=1 Tax=Streptomyces nigrescens TaxID=1920 RepID=UPI003469CA33